MKRLLALSIRTRLLVAYFGIILLGFSGLTLIAGRQITTAVRADYEQRLQNEVQLVAQSIGSSLDVNTRTQLDDAQIGSILKELETQAGGKLTLYRADRFGGPPPVDSRTPHDDGGRAAITSMPEIETSLHGGTVLVERKNDAGEDVLYTAAPILLNGQITAVIQLAVPAQNVQGVTLQRWAVLGLGFALLTSLALLAALMLSRSIIQPLYRLRESAVRLSQGDFSHRVTPIPNDEIGEVAHAFNNMADEVQSMLEEQKAFASNTSHELRTPLTAIRLRTEALRNDTSLDDATAKQYIAEIDDEVVQLGNLVQDLTLLSRFDAGRAELGRDQIDLNRLATSLYQSMYERAHEKQIEWVLSLPNEPVLINASLSHLTVVFRNLLDNALKYTPGGGQINWRVQTAEGDVCSIIQDTGQGISAQHLPHLYERFYRADKARSRDIPGTGLGLALVKSILDAYKARITIQSDGLGKGTTVTIYWPLEKSPP